MSNEEKIYGWECRLLEVQGQIVHLEKKEIEIKAMIEGLKQKEDAKHKK